MQNLTGEELVFVRIFTKSRRASVFICRPYRKSKSLHTRTILQRLRPPVHASKPSGFGSVADPGFGASLTPGSWMGKKSRSGIRIRDEHSGSYFRELRNIVLG